jgi:hypothetical protein
MTVLKTLLHEIIGLFVDDGLLALAVLAVVGLGAWTLNDSRFDETDAAAALVGGCLVVLMASVVRAAWLKRASRQKNPAYAKLLAQLDEREGRP